LSKLPVQKGKKKGDSLKPLLFNLALEYVNRKVQKTQDGLKLYGTHQLLAYANSVALVREQTIPTERPPLVGEVSADFYGYRGVAWLVRRIPYGCNLGFQDRV
jgi:hypothetical protein